MNFKNLNGFFPSIPIVLICLGLGIFLTISSCSRKPASTRDKAISEDDTEEIVENQEIYETTPAVPRAHTALLTAYPDQIKEISDNYITMANGERILFDDGEEKNFQQRLDDSDVEDMFYDVYFLPDPVPEYLHDTGRTRSDALFKAMYGKSAAEVQSRLVSVPWFGQTVQFTPVNGAADSLKAVAKEIERFPELQPYLKSSGTFYWRQVRGANRMSAHSYGIAFDIAVDKSDYWLWKTGNNDELQKVEYANKIPRQLVEIFQKHGFIWGGSWYHFDTMHFEFRPEILAYANLMK